MRQCVSRGCFRNWGWSCYTTWSYRCETPMRQYGDRRCLWKGRYQKMKQPIWRLFSICEIIRTLRVEQSSAGCSSPFMRLAVHTTDTTTHVTPERQSSERTPPHPSSTFPFVYSCIRRILLTLPLPRDESVLSRDQRISRFIVISRIGSALRHRVNSRSHTFHDGKSDTPMNKPNATGINLVLSTLLATVGPLHHLDGRHFTGKIQGRIIKGRIELVASFSDRTGIGLTHHDRLYNRLSKHSLLSVHPSSRRRESFQRGGERENKSISPRGNGEEQNL